MTVRSRMKSRSNRSGGYSYDTDAAAYIAAAGALFPSAVNQLVLAMKAAGLWTNHLGMLKFAVGVPSLAASMIDMRNQEFNGIAVNNPSHSALSGWTFVAASSQYIDTGWRAGAPNSMGTQNSSHLGLRMRAGSAGFVIAGAYNNPNYFSFIGLADGFQQFGLSDPAPNTLASPNNPVAPGSYIATRTGPSTSSFYADGVFKEVFSTPSGTLPSRNIFLGCNNNNGTAGQFTSGRYSCIHGGSGMNAAQIADLNSLLNAYAIACGET